MRNNTLKLLILAALVLALGAPLYARDLIPTFTQSGGAFISNWYWLRPSNPGTVTYTFKDPTTMTSDKVARLRFNCQIPVVALVTNTASGEGGHSKMIQVTVSSGGQYTVIEGAPARVVVKTAETRTETYIVMLQNAWSAPAPSRPPGAGYKATGTLVLPDNVCENFRLTGNLVVTYAFAADAGTSQCCPSSMNHHVAFNDPARWTDPTWRSMVIRY